MAVAAAVAVVGVAEVVVVEVSDYSKIRRFGKRKSDTCVHVKCSVWGERERLNVTPPVKSL